MSELALKLIAENKKTRSPLLDLSNCGLTEVPIEIGELVWLEELSFASSLLTFYNGKRHLIATQNSGPTNKLDRLAQSIKTNPFSRLPNLKRLCISDAQVSDLTPLAGLANLQRLDVGGAPITDLTPLAGLANLQLLNVAVTRITELTPLAGLANLQRLFVFNTQITDLTPLAGLANLQGLYVSDPPITDLTPLANLANLQELDVSNTPITDLTPLADLANFQRLVVSNTRITDLNPLLDSIKRGLPVKWSSSFLKGNGIYLAECPLTNPPAEIVKQGNAAILNYFAEQQRQGVDHLYEAKMLIIGEGGAGKTTLLRRLYQCDKPMPDESETTQGIDIHRHEFKLDNGRTFRLNVWDFGGQEIYHATHQFFLTRRSLYVLLDDTRKDDKSAHDPAFKYWLEVADLLGGHSPVLIFQNEKGGRSKSIDEAGIKGKFGNVKDVYRGNLEEAGAADKRGESLFLRKLVLGVPAQASSKNYATAIGCAAPAVLLLAFYAQQGA